MSTSSSPPTPPDLEYKSYSEDRDWRVEGEPKIDSRSYTVVYRLQDKKWWIKVTFDGKFPPFSGHSGPVQIKSKRERERGKEFQNFVSMINFQELDLLDDTVTEVILREDAEVTEDAHLSYDLEDASQFTRLFEHLHIHIQEDPSRVTYPPRCGFPSFRAVKPLELIEEQEITAGVSRVFHKGDNKQYVLKVVNRPLYYPQDSDVIRQELANLEQFKGVSGIVQPAGVAVIPNPYATNLQDSDPETVISGILMEFYSGGTLESALYEELIGNFNLQRWAFQMGNALDTLHKAGKTHMDMKPSNVVLDDAGNAILIDISGIGGMTNGWRAPELQDNIGPCGLPFESRRLNDAWAYGTLLKKLVSKAEDSSSVETLKLAAGRSTQDVHTRCTVSEAMSLLDGAIED